MQRGFLGKMVFDKKEWRKNYYLQNREKEKLKMKEYYNNHKKKLTERQAEYYNNHKKRISKRDKEKYLENRIEFILKARKYYWENKKEILEKAKRLWIERPELIKQWKKKYALNNPEKVKARNLAKYHIQIPENQICEECGINKATDRHHEDYSKPLEVKFVCHQCNNKLERIEYVKN
jgi:hypothetical protein